MTEKRDCSEVGIGQSSIKLNFDLAGQLPWQIIMSHILHAWLQKFIFIQTKNNLCFWNISQTQWKYSKVIYFTLHHRRTSLIIALLPKTKFVIPIVKITATDSFISLSFIILKSISRKINSLSHSSFKSFIAVVQNGGDFVGPNGITLNVYFYHPMRKYYVSQSTIRTAIW